MDVTLTPYVDVVGDAHALPFRPATFDFVLSLAVIEHLRQPFLAAQETFDVLRNGGYVYGDCNFVFAYHGYPHHYFNASAQGLEQAFAQFEELRTGVAPYQMPSFAIFMLLTMYLYHMSLSNDPEVLEYRHLLQEVLDQPLQKYDSLFTEQAALNVAAGVFYFGRKAIPGRSEVIPAIIQDFWEGDPELKRRFPELFNLGTWTNIMLWAKQEGRQHHSAIDDFFRDLTPFCKSETVGVEGQKFFDTLPLVDTLFHTIQVKGQGTLLGKKEYQERQRLKQQIEDLTATIKAKNRHIEYLGSLIKQIESGRVMKLLRAVNPKKE